MTRAIGADHGLRPSLSLGGWGPAGSAQEGATGGKHGALGHPGAADPLGGAHPLGASPHLAAAGGRALQAHQPAAGLHWLDPQAPSGHAPVTPGRLVADSQDLCRGLLRLDAGQGLAAFACEKAPGRGLVACLAPGELALVLRNGQSVGLAVEPVALEALAACLLQRLGEFGQLGGARPEWALGLDIGGLSASERGQLARLATEFRLGVQDLSQGIWVVDRLGGLYPHWPPGVRFQPEPA